MRNRLIVPVLGLLLAGCTEPSPPGSLAGQWGGEHAGLVVSKEGVRVEFDCAGGSIAGTVALDRAGRFSENGAYIRGGGPVPIDDSTRAEPARYDGRAGTLTMELTVTVLEEGATYGPFLLTRGGNPSVYKCD